MMLKTFLPACLVGSVAATDDALSLLQLNAQPHIESSAKATSCAIGGNPITFDECSASGDPHIILKGKHINTSNHYKMYNAMAPGILPMARHCSGDVFQAYQCRFPGYPHIGGLKGYAVKMGDFNIRVVSHGNNAATRVCIDELDGCQDMDYYVGDLGDQDDVYIQRDQTGIRIRRRSTDMQVYHTQSEIGLPNMIVNAYMIGTVSDAGEHDLCFEKVSFPNITWQGEDDPNTVHYERPIFTAEDLDEFCRMCTWQGDECQKPVPSPPAPVTAKIQCKENNVDYANAKKCCERVEGDPILYKECLFDYCLEGNEEVCTDYVIMDDNAGRPFCLSADEDTDECTIPAGGVCKNSPKLDLTNVVENSLAEGGKLVYGNAGTINGKQVDLVLTATGYQGTTGNSGEFGVFNQKCGTESEVTFTIVQSGTATPEPIEMATLSYYDLDEGKRGKGRMTVETCNAKETILASNTELTQVVAGPCVAVTSSKRGNAKDNPTSLMELDPIQRARAVTYEFEKLSTWKSKVKLARCSGGRGLFFSLRPAVACTPGADLVALGWIEGVETLPEDRKECTLGGCPWREGGDSEACCMNKNMILLKSWTASDRKIRDTCLQLGMNWCTQDNKKVTFEMMKTHPDGGVDPNNEKRLKNAQRPARTFLESVGMFGKRPHLLEAKRD